jgi:diguanylate cyclase (GGDEF)-like protein/PAS domain S-box-containing protein
MSPRALTKSALRLAAEARFAEDLTLPTLPSEALLHELQVHQIELEMQNEALLTAQIELESSRDRYVSLYDFAPLGYLTLSREGMVIEANLTVATLLGVLRSKLKPNRFERFIAVEYLDLWQRQLAAAWRDPTNSSHNFELQLKRSNGQFFPALLHSVVIETSGVPPVLRIAVTDITARKQSEDALRIAAIAFESQEGMIVTDADAVIIRVNQAFTDLTGYTAAEAIGKTPAILHSGRQDPAFYQEMWQTLRQSHYWQGEIWNRRKNGEIFAEWLTLSAVLTPTGAISHFVGSFSDITQKSMAAAEIKRLAYYDPLTQLPNRRALQDRLDQALAATTRHALCGAILFIDLDNFKTLNDTRGHDIGDLLLAEIAERLRVSVREGDTVGRLGGDEFIVILEGLSAVEKEAAMLAKQIGEKLNQAIAAPCQLKNTEHRPSASIGVSLFCTEEDASDMLKQADLAMYDAKSAGRNTLRFFDPKMQAIVTERAAIEADLHQAVLKHQFVLYYQAQVSGQQVLIGAEALVRWQHPQRGLISPAEFIPAAEESGLILPLGQWVLETACAQLAAWAKSENSADSGMAALTLAVNVSAKQFNQANFVEQVLAVLKRSGANPQRLKLELTESLLVSNIEDVSAKMNALKAEGIGFSLDDFGTGYSSLAYLKRLPLDQLKIDQGFVRDILDDPNDAAIAKMVIALADSMGLTVIAEGVETEPQRAFLAEQGCHHYQGYLCSRPLPVDEFAALAKRLK